MRRRSIFARLAIAVLVVAAPAVANPPNDQYEPFAGEAPTVRDHYTGLEWERNVGKDLLYSNASFYCSTVGLSAGRIPTIKELETIFDEEAQVQYEFGKNVQKYIWENTFPQAAVDKPYWSQTPANGNPDERWGLDFSTGQMVRLKTATDVAYVRCMQ